jgi:hypothetical protein
VADRGAAEVVERFAAGPGRSPSTPSARSGYRYSKRPLPRAAAPSRRGQRADRPDRLPDLSPLSDGAAGRRVGAARREPGPGLPGRGRHGARRGCSTPSWPAGWPASSGSAWAPWWRTSSACGWRRATRPPTGPPGRCRSPGSSTPRSTSRCCSSCGRPRGRAARPGQAGAGRRGVRGGTARAPGRPAVDPWRRTSGIHRMRNRRQLAGVRAMWEARDAMARRRDTAPGRILPDAAIVAAVTSAPRSPAELMALPVFGGRSTRRHVDTCGAPCSPPPRCRTPSCRSPCRAATARPRPTGGPSATRSRPPGWPACAVSCRRWPPS